MAIIDLDKVKACYDHQDSDAGQEMLVNFRIAIQELREALPGEPSDAEFMYYLKTLVQAMPTEDLDPAKQDELTDGQLEEVAGGVFAGRAFKFGFRPQIQRLGGGRTKYGNLGFVNEGAI
jgi:hypothetical protein